MRLTLFSIFLPILKMDKVELRSGEYMFESRKSTVVNQRNVGS